jgi:hypothetical protein
MTVAPNEGLTTFEIISIFSKLLPDPNHRAALMLWGLTGTGKSQIQRQILAQLSEGKPAWKPAKGVTTTGALEVIGDWGLVDLRTSLLEPTDLRGLPDLKGSTVRWVAPDELPLVGQEDRFPEKGVLFLDEMTHAQPAMQSACFSLVLDRRCGPHVLLPKWKLVSASNYERENANTYQLSGPLRSRFEHYHLRCSLEAFKEWGWGYQDNIDGDCSGAGLACRTSRAHPVGGVQKIDRRIIAFLNLNPDFLHKPTESPEEGFPTPRSWANASYSLQSFKNGFLEKVLGASVGPGTAGMFNGFLEVFNSPELNVNIRAVLAKKAKSPALTTQKPNIAWAFAACLCGHVKDDPKLLPAAIEHFCSDVWKDALEIGRTGLADLKHVVGKDSFTRQIQPYLSEVTKRYGKLL